MLLFCGTLEEKFPAIVDWLMLKGVSVINDPEDSDSAPVVSYNACVIEATPGRLMSQCGFPEMNFREQQLVTQVYQYWAVALDLSAGTELVVTQQTVRDGILVVDGEWNWPMPHKLPDSRCGLFLAPYRGESYMVAKADQMASLMCFCYEFYVSEQRYMQVRCN
jgi:hypothetical protein